MDYNSYIDSIRNNNKVYAVLGQGQSNENILRNPFFTVNQREETSWQENAGATVDGWTAWAGSGTGGEVVYSSAYHQLRITSGDTLRYGIHQNLSGYLPAGIYTLSAHVWSIDSGNIQLQFCDKQGSTITRKHYSQDFTEPETGNGFYVSFTAEIEENTVNCIRIASDSRDSDFRIRKVKLEVGGQSTLENDVYIDQQKEVEKCLKYFYRLKSTQNLMLSSDVASGASTIYSTIAIPTMVAEPTITASNNNAIIATQAATTSSDAKESTGVSLYAVNSVNSMAEIKCNFSGLTAGDAYRIILKAGEFIDFSCE